MGKTSLVKLDAKSIVRRIGDRDLAQKYFGLVQHKLRQEGHQGRFDNFQDFMGAFEEFLRREADDAMFEAYWDGLTKGHYITFKNNAIPGISSTYGLARTHDGRLSPGDGRTLGIGRNIGCISIPDPGEMEEIRFNSEQAFEDLQALYHRLAECAYNDGKPVGPKGPWYGSNKKLELRNYGSGMYLDNKLDSTIRVFHGDVRVLSGQMVKIRNGDLISVGPIVFNYLKK